MKDKVVRVILVLAGLLAAFAIGTHSQGPVRPVPMLMNDIAIQEAVYFRENGQYADPTALPEARADLTRIDEEGYTWMAAVSYKDEKVVNYHVQSWKARDCNNGGMMSYYIQQNDVLRYRCSTENGVAGVDDQKVE